MSKKHPYTWFFNYITEWKTLPFSYNLRLLKLNEKICNTCFSNFKDLVGITNKPLQNYFFHFGYPDKWIHSTPYLNCESCRKVSRNRRAKRRLNVAAEERYLLNYNKIQEEIVNGTFGKRNKNKLDLLWIKKASLFVNKLKLDYKPSRLEKMRIYKEYRDHQDKRFYSSQKWKSLKNIITNIYGKTCMKCSYTPTLEKEVHCDHIYPRSLYSEHELNPFNLQILCVSCNSSKSNTKIVDYRTQEHKKLLLENISNELISKYEPIEN